MVNSQHSPRATEQNYAYHATQHRTLRSHTRRARCINMPTPDSTRPLSQTHSFPRRLVLWGRLARATCADNVRGPLAPHQPVTSLLSSHEALIRYLSAPPSAPLPPLPLPVSSCHSESAEAHLSSSASHLLSLSWSCVEAPLRSSPLLCLASQLALCRVMSVGLALLTSPLSAGVA